MEANLWAQSPSRKDARTQRRRFLKNSLFSALLQQKPAEVCLTYIDQIRIMKNNVFVSVWLALVVMMAACTGNAQTKSEANKPSPKKDTANIAKRTDAEWKAILTPEQYHVLREKGTDRPYAGKYYLHNEKGVYSCAGCGTELFTSDMKFACETGWPGFDKEIGAGNKIKKIEDRSFGMVRTEIVCAKCGSHLGHLFDDGPTLTGLRYCVNSTSIDFTKKEKP
jgi:peptide-methionine (R)-S-oxide reductase